MKAQDILNHCEAVVAKKADPNGCEIERNYYGYYVTFHGFGLSIPASGVMTEREIAKAARLLGLDKPEVVLEWLPDTDGEVVAFNGYLNAATWHFVEHTKARIYLRNIVLMELDFRGDDRKEKAQEWCEQMLKSITTPTPKQ